MRYDIGRDDTWRDRQRRKIAKELGVDENEADEILFQRHQMDLDIECELRRIGRDD